MVREDFLEESPFTWALEEKWADHCEHECDGCFKDPKGCMELEGIREGFIEMAPKAQGSDIPGLL